MSDATRTLFEAVPASAMGVLYVDAPRSFWDELIGSEFFIPTTDATRKALDAELRAYVKQNVGVEVAKFKTAVSFVDPVSEGFAVMAQGIAGTLPGEPAGTHQDAELRRIDDDVVAQRGGVTVVGNDAGVKAALDVLAGKAKGMVAEGTPLWKWLEADCAGAFIGVAATVAGVPDPGVQVMAGQFGIEKGCLHLGHKGMRAVVSGDGDKLKNLVGFADQAIGQLVSELEQTKREATAPGSPVPDGIGAIIAYHQTKDLIEKARPRMSGDRLVSKLDMSASDPMMLTAMVGIGAAVAIPAFMKYIKKSKSSEAMMFTKKLYDGVRFAAANQMPGQAFTLPPSVGPTPPLGTCCANGGKCAPDAAVWDHPTWIALQFSVDDPHYYSYEFINNGTTFIVRAQGDLDCDGTYSTFEMTGAVTPDGEVVGSGAVSRVDELE